MSLRDFNFYLDHLSRGCLIQPFERQGVPFACWMTDVEPLTDEVRTAVGLGCRLTDRNLDTLAARLIFGRHPVLLEELSSLWETRGSDRRTVQHVVEATKAALVGWSAEVVVSDDTTVYSRAYTDFASSLNEVKIAKDDGPIGRAVRQSRFYAGSWPNGFLEGESAKPAGLPVVLNLPQPSQNQLIVRNSVWLDAYIPMADPRMSRSNQVHVLERVRHVLSQAPTAFRECVRIPEDLEPIIALADNLKFDSSGLAWIPMEGKLANKSACI